MLRLKFLNLKGHPQLGEISLSLSDGDDDKINVTKPYTSIIIGVNGTGKSYILRSITEIFRQLKAMSDHKAFNIPFDFHLQYQIYHNTYDLVGRSIAQKNKRVSRREYTFYKNKPQTLSNGESSAPFNKDADFEVNISEIEFPERLLVNSVMLNDRFIWQDSKPEDFYQYLGVRSTSGSTSTKSSSKRTIKHLFNATISNKEFTKTLKDLLLFLDFEESFQVHYTTKINKLFFSNNLTKENFKKYYEKWWDEDFEFSKRKKENPLWSIPYYNNNFKEDEEKIDNLIDYLKRLSTTENRFKDKPNSSAKIISIDLFDINTTEIDLQMISHLENLDIVNLDGIKIKKKNSTLSINEVSSGEYHLLISLIGMFANISYNSLLLIDEPEISLHPNWQMKYISFLKNVFAKFSSCQFIITTHSHFLVSDLEGDNSSVTSLQRDPETGRIAATLMRGTNTYGWSAEEVLYSVFKVKTTRNFYLETDLRELLHKIAIKSKDKQRMSNILKNLHRLNLTDKDPLKLIISKAEEYLANDNSN